PTAHTDEIGLFAAKYRFSFADNRQSYESETGRLPAYFFLRRPCLAVRPLRAASALSIANSSSLRPCLMRAVSHRGRAPRPAQVSPPGPRYLGATLRPFSAERRPNTAREITAAWPLSPRRREKCFSSSVRFWLTLLSMSVRSASSASASITFRLISAIRRLPFVELLDRTIQSKGKASTPKWHATHIKRIRPSSWYPVTAGILRLGGAPFDKSIVPCGIDLPPQLSRSGGRASTSFLKVVKEQGSRRSHQSLELERLQQSRPSRCLHKLDGDAVKGMIDRAIFRRRRQIDDSPDSTHVANGHCRPLRLFCNTAAQFARR